jgi:hypothetical protein
MTLPAHDFETVVVFGAMDKAQKAPDSMPMVCPDTHALRYKMGCTKRLLFDSRRRLL